MRILALALIGAIALGACRDAQPPLPTAEQRAQLDEAEAMLNAEAENSAKSE